MSHHKIFIIVINWNGKEDTLECLESIRQIEYRNFSTVVVDNGSKDDSVRSIQKSFPEVIVLETGENLGFAGGNNIGMRYAMNNGADFILLLNNDAVVDSQLLKNFMKPVQNLEQGGVFGAKIYYYSQPDRIWFAGGKWVIENKQFTHIGLDCIDNGSDFNSITETDYACGCALFLKTEVLQKIGLFDERFFLIFEETDLCYRAKRAGYKCFFVPEAKVWHKESVSFGGRKAALYHYFLERNILLWAEKNLPVRDRIIIYRQVFKSFLSDISPPRFHFNTPGLLRGIYSALAEYKNTLEKKFKDPMRTARLLAIRDYCLRHFGNCPETVRLLGK